MIYLYFCALQNLFFASVIMDLFVGVDLPVEVCGSSLEFAKLESCQGRDDFSISDSKKYSFGFLLKLT